MGTSIVTVGMNWAEFKCSLLPLWFLSAFIPLLVRTLSQEAFTEHLLSLIKKNDVKLKLFSLINKMINGIKGGQFSIVTKKQISDGFIKANIQEPKELLPWFLASTDNFSLSIACSVPGANNMKSISNEQ